MAASTRSRPRAKQDEAVKDEKVAEPAEQAERQPDGVFIVKVVDENGNIGIDAQPVGNVQATEVLTILELAQNAFRAKIGLGGQPTR